MPHYEYACKDCGEHLEVVQSIKDDPLTECPACGGSLRKLFSAIGIQFNGPGFYRTDHRRRVPNESSSSKPADKGAGGGGSSGGSSSTSSSSSESSTGTAKVDSSQKSGAAAS